MPARRQDVPGPTTDRALEDEEFHRPLPVVLAVAGILVVVTAPLAADDIGGPFGARVALLYVALGALALATAVWLRAAAKDKATAAPPEGRAPASPGRPGPQPRRSHTDHAYAVVTLLVASFLVADQVHVRLTGTPNMNSALWLLLGAGFVVLRLRWLHFVMAVSVAGWLVLFWDQRSDAHVAQYGFLVAAGVFFGYMANAMRRQAIHRVARARGSQRESLEALELALREIQHSEKRLQVLTEGSPVGIFHTDPRGIVDYANQRWMDIAGCDYHDFESIRQAVHPDDRAALTAKWRNCLQTGEELVAEFRYRHADGAVVHCSTRATALRDAAGAITGWAGTLEDITQRVKAADADRVAYARLLEIEQLKEIDRFKTRILNAASHELNTPLTPLKLQVHLLGSGALGPMSEAQRKSVRILDRNLVRLGALVSDVLDVARLQSGHLHLDLAPVAVAVLAREAAESYQAPAAAAGIQLDVAIEGDPEVPGDAMRLSQILYNLLGNALKFTPAGGRVLLRVAARDGTATMTVTDTGCGMRPDQMARLFQPFSQVHDPALGKQNGTGLGLYISRGIAEQHGGTLEAESPGPGQGSTFRLSLPLAQATQGARVAALANGTTLARPHPEAAARGIPTVGSL